MGLTPKIKKKERFFILFVVCALTASLLPFWLLSPEAFSPKTSHSEFLEASKKTKKQRIGRSTDSDLQSHSRQQNIKDKLKSPLRQAKNATNTEAKAAAPLPAVAVSEQVVETCAILFFGLPRSFQLLVLPSIVQNILKPNQQHHCDIYVHYYHIEQESGGRSGYGGTIDPNEVRLLPDAVHEIYADQNIVISRTKDTNQTFWDKRGALLKKYRTTIAADGNYLYFPWMAKSYHFPTSMDNIVKQWHSIQSVWEDMEQHAKQLHRNYTRVAMLRNDVVYVTPFDIYQIGTTGTAPKSEILNKAVVPNWARFPINDRMLAGPYRAVKVWATERFERLETHVLTYEEPGYGMHSERFLNHSIFPAIRDMGVEVVADPDICFFRARADGSTWINDCTTRNGAARGFRKIDTQKLVEDLVGKSCQRSKFNAKTLQLHCNDLPANVTDADKR